MTYEWAKPGVKVICVNDACIHGLLKEGEVYEIRETQMSSGYFFLGERQGLSLKVYLVGFRDEYLIELPDEDRFVRGFNIKRFRPLITKRLPDTLTILLEKPNRLIVPDGFDNLKTKTRPKEKIR